jgi:integrase
LVSNWFQERKNEGDIMASIFKRKYRKVVDGKKVKKQSKSWHIKYRDAEGLERRVKGHKDKAATQQLAAKLEKEAELGREGIVDRCKEHRKRPLREHLEDFGRSLLAKGNTKKHALQTVQRVKTVIEGCKFITWNDIQPSKVQNCIASLRDSKNGIGAATSNYYLKAVKQFCRWLVQDRRANESPLEHLRCETVRKVVDEVHPRRALEVDELRRLLEVTKVGPKRFGMTGNERYLLYRLTAETGLRAKELRSLRVSSFDFDNLTVRVSGEYTKNKREAVQQLRRETAEELKEFFTDKLPTVKAFGGTYKQLTKKTADMLKPDLADADIQYVVDGFYFDFHALRHQTGTLLAAGGVHPKVAQSIMRHGDINLTLSRYTHTLTGQEAKAVEAMPDLSLPSSEKKTATGTDDKCVAVAQNGPAELTPKLTPKSTPTAYPECNQMAPDVSSLGPKAEKVEVHKRLPGGKLSTRSNRLSSSVINKVATRPVGLETSSNGLLVRCSLLASARRNTYAGM